MLQAGNERRAAEVAEVAISEPDLALAARRMISQAAECAQIACAKAGDDHMAEASSLLERWRQLEAGSEERDASIQHLRREEQELLEHHEELASELRETESCVS